ncbi:MAG TPA: hypothetical protein VLM79_16180 [Kofleriaceae bacterium]|nr:hypothetical protein [Kofleriaceae bacterium]
MRSAGFLLVAATACGASSHSIEAARAARYRGDKLALFDAARQATAAKYQLAESDENTLRIVTTGRWYRPDGMLASERSNDMRDVPDRSVHLQLIVTLVPSGSDWAVEIEPVMMRYFAGRPNPDRLTLDDPSVPGWATGRIGKLREAIHEALARYEVKSTAGWNGPLRDPDDPGRNRPENQSATQLLPR